MGFSKFFLKFSYDSIAEAFPGKNRTNDICNTL